MKYSEILKLEPILVDLQKNLPNSLANRCYLLIRRRMKALRSGFHSTQKPNNPENPQKLVALLQQIDQFEKKMLDQYSINNIRQIIENDLSYAQRIFQKLLEVEIEEVECLINQILTNWEKTLLTAQEIPPILWLQHLNRNIIKR